MRPSGRSNERGVALIFAMLLTFLVAGLAVGVLLMMSNGNLISKFHVSEAAMESVADAGLEVGRDLLNGNGNQLVGVSYRTLQDHVAVTDAAGAVIPGFTRSVYAGLTGNTTGQYGVFASVVSVVESQRGAQRGAGVVRRAELSQESFAKFARFDDRTVSSTVFASGIQVFGPLHTNQTLYVGNGATFWGPVTTASTINSPSGSTFKQGYTERVANIPMPTPADLAALQTYATTGNTNVAGVAGVPLTTLTPSVRIEFVALDINGDGQFNGANEGFMRVFRANANTTAALNYVTAREWNPGTPNDPNLLSPNCGGTVDVNPAAAVRTEGAWTLAPQLSAVHPDSVRSVYGRSPNKHCYLGGDPRLTGSPVPPALPVWTVNAPVIAPVYGSWLPWPGWGGAAPAAVQNARFRDGTQPAPGMGQYLWPVNRGFNLNFKGVVYVDGAVAVSGELRGQVTVASTGNISLADDLTYVTQPGSQQDCEADILGLLTPQFFYIQDNNVNAPFQSGPQNSPQAGVGNLVQGYYTGFDESADESLNGSVLTLNSLASENVFGGANVTEVCNGTPVGRGCFRMSGSAIQGINAPRMALSGGGATGWNPQWTYDRCTAIKPPPYFPTTGRYYKNRFYEIDPVGFDVAAWYTANQ